MQTESYRFGGGAAETVLHPVTAVGMLIAILLILSRAREKAVIPFVLAFFSVPVGQVVVLGGVHFTVLRILILTVLARMVASGPSERKFAGGFNSIDKVVVLWSLSVLAFFCFQFMETQALIKGMGDLVDSLGGYLAMRFLIPNREAIRRTVKALAVVCVIQGACMISEQLTGQNVFSSLGANSPTFREGHIRSEGALGTLYGGPLAGFLIPLFLWLWKEEKSQLAACAGIAGAAAMVFASHASTAVMACGGSLVGLGFWPLRRNMRLVRWGLVGTLAGLHLVMNGPVWSLIEHIDLTGGSSSFHRYMLVDNCIRHFGDWWLLGSKDYGSWGWLMWDLCNQFVVAAVTGGLVTLALFIGIYKRSFGAIGTARKQLVGDRGREGLLWCLGSVLFANVVASFGINYMVHLMTLFFILLACISVATLQATQTTARRAEARDHDQFSFVPKSESTSLLKV